MYGKIILLAILSLILGGCSYPVKPVSVPAVGTYSSYDEKIQGTWVIVFDDGVNNISREVQSSSHACSAYTYPINIGDAFTTSIKQTMRSVFENTVEQSIVPSTEELHRIGAKGSILVRVESYEPGVYCSVKGFSGYCTVQVDIELEIIVHTEKDEVFSASIGDSAIVEGDSGSACQNVSDALSEATSKSLKETLEKVAERIINTPKLRKATVSTAPASVQSDRSSLTIQGATKLQSANYYAISKCGVVKGDLTFLGVTNGEEKYSAICDSGGLLVIGCTDQGCKSL